MVEELDEASRFEHGGLSRECEAALIVAALQRTVEIEDE
jgi:hypothetical protein